MKIETNYLPSSAPSLPAIHPKYRADIDGLRAIAVLAVVLFHAFPSSIKGGFVGVDIFFVISGFLISTILFSSLDQGRFSFIDFYSRRIKRIFPTLLIVLIFCYAFGWVSLLPDEFEQLGKHIAGGSGFISNFLYWKESGYFDNSADTKPLLHLWSLGVEEQFYIVWPLFLWFAWKRRINLLAITLLFLAASFMLNIWKINSDPVLTFYSPQTRFWELLVGAILAYIALYKKNLLDYLGPRPDQKTSEQIKQRVILQLPALLGMGLIVIGLLIMDKAKQFPGWWAILPTLGTFLIIAAGPHSWLNKFLLSHPLLKWFGLISFPLYLWHWPLLAFMRILQSQPPSFEMRLAAVLLAILLAWLTYTLIEKPIRFGKNGNTKLVALIGIMICVGALGFYTKQSKGLPSRNVVKVNPDKNSGVNGGDLGQSVIECGISDNTEKALFGDCRRDIRGVAKYALLGDSKAAALYGGLVRTSDEKGRWMFIGGNGPNGAPVPVLSSDPKYASYQKLLKIALNTINNNEKIETVVVVAAARALFQLKNVYSIEDLPNSKNYATALAGLQSTTDQIIHAGKKVMLVVDNPTLPDPRECIGRVTTVSLLNKALVKQVNPRCEIKLARQTELAQNYLQLLKAVQATNPEKITIFDTYPYLCDAASGKCQAFKDGRLLYSYSDHISDYAAGLIGKDINKAL